MKHLIATKVKDGWRIEVTNRIFVLHRDDVGKIARENGLIIAPYPESTEKRIYAD